MKFNKITVNTSTKKYKIFLGSDIINKIHKILNSQKIYFEKCLIIVDKNIPKKFKNKLFKKIKAKKKNYYNFNATEKNKNYENVKKLHNLLFINKFNRNDCIISFGGGITGDIGGFTASIFKRGLKFINIPSTLLSQVDSSIGGKTGINNKFGKNLIGSFHQPDLVISDMKVLSSLPYREIICGYAEILKSSLIKSSKSFSFLDKNIYKILKLKSPYIEKAIIDSCNLKKQIVEKDEREKNLRKVLNIGHTFAHAFESTMNFSKKLNHGEAVLLGIRNAIKFSKKIKLLSNEKFLLINNHINKLKLKHSYNKLFKKKDLNKIIEFMKSDKKNNSNNINLILIRDFGKIKINFQIKTKRLRRFLLSELNE